MRHEVRRAVGVLTVASALAMLSLVEIATAPLAAAAVATCPSTTYGIHYHAPGSGKTIALTFDDGPGASTARIMKILKHARVEATFFNLGEYEDATPTRVRAEQTAGFALGDHTWDHGDLVLLSAADQAREIDRERREQAAITGAYPCLLRPPYGDYNATTLRLAQNRGMRVWCWSVDTEDWKAAGSDAPYWVHRIVARAEAGADQRHPVILMHNQVGGNPATVDALPTVIKYYKSHGYRFVDLYGHTGHPVVTHISPSSGPASGGTRVTVTGHGFIGVQQVRFGAFPGTSVKVESRRKLLVTSPRHPARTVHIRVVTTFGGSPRSSADRFTYLPG